jgi:3-dehydroquinate dehydratase
MSTRVLVLNGPNLGRLGKREPSVYGTATYADLVALCEKAGQELGLAVEVRQTEYEGQLPLSPTARTARPHRRATSGLTPQRLSQ